MSAETRAAEQQFEQLSARLLTDPAVSRGTGFGSAAGLRVGRKIFAMLGRDGELVVKLAKEPTLDIGRVSWWHPLLSSDLTSQRLNATVPGAALTQRPRPPRRPGCAERCRPARRYVVRSLRQLTAKPPGRPGDCRAGTADRQH
jgi:hypothetical protein